MTQGGGMRLVLTRGCLRAGVCPLLVGFVCKTVSLGNPLLACAARAFKIQRGPREDIG